MALVPPDYSWTALVCSDGSASSWPEVAGHVATLGLASYGLWTLMLRLVAFAKRVVDVLEAICFLKTIFGLISGRTQIDEKPPDQDSEPENTENADCFVSAEAHFRLLTTPELLWPCDNITTSKVFHCFEMCTRFAEDTKRYPLRLRPRCKTEQSKLL